MAQALDHFLSTARDESLLKQHVEGIRIRGVAEMICSPALNVGKNRNHVLKAWIESGMSPVRSPPCGSLECCSIFSFRSSIDDLFQIPVGS